MARECRCSCDAFAWVLRVVTLLAYLALMAAAGWGFPLAHKRFTAQTTVNGTSTLNNVDQVLNQLSGLSSNFAFFQGVMSVYFFVFGAVGVLSELRTKCLRETVLARLAFLLSWFGRGSFALYVGLVLVTIPWDDDRPFVSKVPGGMLLGMGVFQLLFWLFVKKDERSARAPAVSQAAAAGSARSLTSSAGGAAPGVGVAPSKIAWGQPEHANGGGVHGDDDEASGRAEFPPTSTGGAGGGGQYAPPPPPPHPFDSQRRHLLVASTLPKTNPVFAANPVHHTALAASAATAAAADTSSSSPVPPEPPAGGPAVVRNPFLVPPPQ